MPKEPLDNLKTMLHNRINNMRNLERVTDTDEFMDAYFAASDSAAAEVAAIVTSVPPDAANKARNWIRKQRHPIPLLEEMTFSQLRELAGQFGIKNYTRKTKPELILEIDNAQDALSAADN